MVIWNKDEGVLDTRVLATHEAQSGQPAGTFGAHRGADIKHQSHCSVVSYVEVSQESCKVHRSSSSFVEFHRSFSVSLGFYRSSSKFRSVSPFVCGFAQLYRLSPSFLGLH